MLQGKQYLKGYQNLLEILNIKTEKYETLKNEYENIGFGVSNGERVMTSLNPDRFTDLLVKVMQAEKEVRKAKLNLIQFEHNVKKRIALLSHDQERKVLIMKYLKLKSFNTIATELNISVRYVHVLHDKALKEFDILFYSL